MNDTCARCGNKLYFFNDSDHNLWFYREFIFEPLNKTFWFDAEIEKILYEHTGYKKYRLCMSCAANLDNLIKDFIEGDSND